MWTKRTNLKENKLIGQGLAEIIILLSHLGEYACEWAYKCNAAPIRNDLKKFLADIRQRETPTMCIM